MGLEIERKFLTKDNSYRLIAESVKTIEQAYLSVYPAPTVRLRLIDGIRAFITIKSKNQGAVRNEWEYEVPANDAKAMFENLHLTGHISKTRYVVGPWEVDEFHGRLEGLVVAEIELDTAESPVPSASFIGREVTHDDRYYNSSLGNCESIPPFA